jgi:hypothetical protein
MISCVAYPPAHKGISPKLLGRIAMSVVKFPVRPKRRPAALEDVRVSNPKRERMVARAERVVELLSTRVIRDGWSFDLNRAARFLHCLRTFDFKDVKDGNSPEFAEILDWVSDHGQSLNWILGGEPSPDSMICMLAGYSPGRRQTRVLEGA